MGMHKIGHERSIIDIIRGRFSYTNKYWKGEIITGIGDFGAALKRPDGSVVGLSMDGVGTKLMIAEILNRNETIGVDLIAMNVNDLAAIGITEELILLNYIAVPELCEDQVSAIVGGMERACHAVEMIAIGGETACMPDIYRGGTYDLAAAVIGFAKSCDDVVVGKNTIECGMRVFGCASSGAHSNGFRTIRSVFGISTEDDYAETGSLVCLNRRREELCGGTLGDALLIPTAIYTNVVRETNKKHRIAGMAHITGGGLVENLPRILPHGCAMFIDTSTWKLPPIFSFIQDRGNLSDMAMRSVFNCGIGFVAVSDEDLSDCGFFEVGEIVETDKEQHVIFA